MMNMTYITKLISALGVFVFFLSIPVSSVEAKTVVRSGDTVSIAEEQIIEGDFYSAANIINVSGEVKQDIISAAGQININGSIGNDALFFAGRTDIHGTIGDDLRIVSGEVIIADPVMGDVFVIGGKVNILSTASISGDVILYAGQVTIEGSIGGDVIGSIDKLRIDAPIAGDVDVTVTELTLGDRANIEGSVRYVSNSLVIQSLNATVAGDLVRSDPVFPGRDMNIRNSLIPVLVLFFSILVWYLVSRRTLNIVVNRAIIRSPRPILLGLGTLMLAPFAGVILLMSMIGSLVGLVILFGYVLMITLSIIGLVAVLGLLLMRAFNQPTSGLTLISLAVGLIGVSLLMLLPVIGQLLLFILMLVTLGAIVDILIRPTLK